MDNDTWSIAVEMNDTLGVMEMNNTWNNVTDMNVSSTPSVPGTQLTESQLISVFAKITYGNFYKYNFPITFVVCLIGLVTNSLNIVVFTRKHMTNSVNFFLTALSVTDIILILSQVPYLVHHFFGFESQFTYSWNVAYIFLIFLEGFGVMTCNWLAVTVGIWRFMAIKWPLRAREWCSMSRAKKILILLVVCGLFISMPVFFLLQVDAYPLYGKTLFSKGYSEWAKMYNSIFLKLFWGSLFMISFVPCFFLVIVNGLLMQSLLSFRRRRRRDFKEQKFNDLETQRQMKKNFKTTAMLTVLLVLFVINSLPDSALVLAAFFSNDDNPKFKIDSKKATDFLRMFNMVNNAISFFVYYFMGENFRSTFKTIFFPSYAAKHSPGKKFSIATNSTDILSASPRASFIPDVSFTLNEKMTDV